MENITVNMENLSAEERAQLLNLIKKANVPKSKTWKPMAGEEYWYINSCGLICNTIRHDSEVLSCISYEYELRLSIGNCFRTRDEAEFAVERLKVVHELRQFASDKNYGQFILCCRNDNSIEVLSCISYTGELHFSTLNDAHAAIQAVGEDRIKKYYFNMED